MVENCKSLILDLNFPTTANLRIGPKWPFLTPQTAKNGLKWAYLADSWGRHTPSSDPPKGSQGHENGRFGAKKGPIGAPLGEGGVPPLWTPQNGLSTPSRPGCRRKIGQTEPNFLTKPRLKMSHPRGGPWMYQNRGFLALRTPPPPGGGPRTL